jgi:hypothetical protein
MLKLKLPSLKSMEIWKEECKDPSGVIGESEGYENTKVVSLDIFDSSKEIKHSLVFTPTISSLYNKTNFEVRNGQKAQAL